MNRSLLIFALVAALGVSFASCKKDKKEEPKSKVTPKEAFVESTKYEDWVYFSFKKGMVVEVSDPMKDMGWDIAFNRHQIRTNSGLSGSGKGGAARTDNTDITATYNVDTLKFLEDKMYFRYVTSPMSPDAKYEFDAMSYMLTTCKFKIAKNEKDEWDFVPRRDAKGEKILDKDGNMIRDVINDPIRGVILRDFKVMPPVYKVRPEVYAIKDAAGNPVLVKFTDFTNEKGLAGYWKFQYVELNPSK